MAGGPSSSSSARAAAPRCRRTSPSARTAAAAAQARAQAREGRRAAARPSAPRASGRAAAAEARRDPRRPRRPPALRDDLARPRRGARLAGVPLGRLDRSHLADVVALGPLDGEYWTPSRRCSSTLHDRLRARRARRDLPVRLAARAPPRPWAPLLVFLVGGAAGSALASRPTRRGFALGGNAGGAGAARRLGGARPAGPPPRRGGRRRPARRARIAVVLVLLPLATRRGRTRSPASAAARRPAARPRAGAPRER